MNSNHVFNSPIGVIGSGQFGTTLANILAQNHKILMYIRSVEQCLKVSKKRINYEQKLNNNISLTTDIKFLSETAKVLFMVIPAEYFSFYIDLINPYLTENHIIIHGTKGLNTTANLENVISIHKKQIQTISQLIIDKKINAKIGCISGPNLVSELKFNEPTGTLIASKDPIVIEIANNALATKNFIITHSDDLIGTELCGALKNIIAVLIGCVTGFKFGLNTKAMFLTKAIEEMDTIGKIFDINPKTLTSLAGIGDLIATCLSTDSRNHYFGYQLSQGFTYEQIILNSKKTFEGVRTIKIIHLLGKHHEMQLPITSTLYDIIYNKAPVNTIFDITWN